MIKKLKKSTRHFNKGSLDYRFIEKIEAGLQLTGGDAKSLRSGTIQFANSRVEIVDGRPRLVNLGIPIYKYSQGQLVDSSRERNLLLSKKEVAKLISWRKQKYMIIPIAIYLRGRWFKVELGVGRKMRKYEKRQQIKEREIKRGLIN
jgi:SsrA-binding protein